MVTGASPSVLTRNWPPSLPEWSTRITPKDAPFNGDPERFRHGIEAHRLGLAYEYDPYFSLSIARIDPLPHQLEAVYEYFLKLPRIRFLLPDDPGAGKTIMAGLLLEELKIRGLVNRTLIVDPANLTFQRLLWASLMACTRIHAARSQPCSPTSGVRARSPR